MPRTEVNRSGEMDAFVQVVDEGGFSAAARRLGMTPSAVSKLIARLERRLGSQLLQRSTRKLTMTAEGEYFYSRSQRVLADIDEAERGAAADAAPRGRVTLNTSVSFGHRMLLPLLPGLMAEWPQISVDLVMTDRIVDLLDERADIAVRWGPLPPSDLVARKLGETGQVIVASPAYLEAHGTPRSPEQLHEHSMLGFTYARRVPDWALSIEGSVVDVPVTGRLRASDGETLRQLAIAGAGLARLSIYHVLPDLESGALVPVLERFNPHDVVPIHAVYRGKPGRLPARVRVVLDFLAEQVDMRGHQHLPARLASAPPGRRQRRVPGVRRQP
ncbi:LysR substrate-binding domain-containing protein [soil metagenome]